jgi:hypothetical protein
VRLSRTCFALDKKLLPQGGVEVVSTPRAPLIIYHPVIKKPLV